MGPVMPQMQKKEEEKMGLLERLGKGIQNYRSDPEKMARLQMGFNTMRLNPDPNIAANAANTIKMAQQKRQLNTDATATIERFGKLAATDPLAAKVHQSMIADPANYMEYLKTYAAQTMKQRNVSRQISGAQLMQLDPTSKYKPNAMYTLTEGPDGTKITEIGEVTDKTVSQKTGVQLNQEQGVTTYDPQAVYNVNPNQSVTRIGGGGVTVNTGDKVPAGLKAVNEAYAKDYLAWRQGGGADLTANVAQIDNVLQQIESGAELTGPMIGAINSVGLLAFVNPEAENAKEQVQEVVQRNLRIVLGAQFAQKEGEQLISRAYNPSLPPEINATRLRKLFTQMDVARTQKEAMAKHFEKNYTLIGYNGPIPKINDFYTALSQFEVNEVVNGFRYLGGDSTKESNWEKVD